MSVECWGAVSCPRKLEELKQKAMTTDLYLHRHRSQLDKIFTDSAIILQSSLRSWWLGFSRAIGSDTWTETLLNFASLKITPSINLEPDDVTSGRAKNGKVLQELLFSDDNITPMEKNLITCVTMGKLKRYPELHGMALSVADKCRRLNEDVPTMRNRYRASFLLHDGAVSGLLTVA